jgi:hypothetical protein
MTKTTKTTKTTTKTEAQTVDFTIIQAQFVDAIATRKAQREAELNGTDKKCTTISADLNEAKSAEFVRQLEHIVKNGFTTPEALSALAQTIKTGTNDDYVAIKVITKIRQCIYALATKQKSKLDAYTNSILFNLSKNQELTNKSGLVSLTKQVQYSETDQVQHVRALVNVSVNTATTQLSSSRQMLRFLDICNVVKAKKNDAISFKENERANAIIAFYAQ